MHLIYFDESGNSGANLADTAQPVFARKFEEQKLGSRLKPVDISWAGLAEPLVHRGDEMLPDVLAWLTDQQKKERPGA